MDINHLLNGMILQRRYESLTISHHFEAESGWILFLLGPLGLYVYHYVGYKPSVFVFSIFMFFSQKTPFVKNKTRWWLHQPFWKICPSNCIMKPQFSGLKWKLFELPLPGILFHQPGFPWNKGISLPKRYPRKNLCHPFLSEKKNTFFQSQVTFQGFRATRQKFLPRVHDELPPGGLTG